MDIETEIDDLEQQRNRLYEQFQEIDEKIRRLQKLKQIIDDVKNEKIAKGRIESELKKIENK